MKDLVIVKSKTINNESVPVIIKVAEVRHGEIMDQRELSRSYIFEDFECVIPIRYAKLLVKQLPNEFHIDRAVEKNASKSVQNAIKSSKIKLDGLTCEICGQENIKSKAGLTAHIRYNHPEKFAELYPTKVKPRKKVIKPQKKTKSKVKKS